MAMYRPVASSKHSGMSSGKSHNLGMNKPKMSKQSVPQQAKGGGVRNPVSKCAKSSY